MQWLNWAKELQALAQTGLYYTKDVYDQERFERIRQIALEMISQLTETPLVEVLGSFQLEEGYQTPKIDTRSVVWKDNRILLVQENDGRWSLPGGWMDITETIRSNAEKELFEEAGVMASASRLIMLLDKNQYYVHKNQFTIVSAFVECDYHSHAFKPNSETVAMGFFDIDQLPNLCDNKTTKQQIELCWQAHQAGEQWRVHFD